MSFVTRFKPISPMDRQLVKMYKSGKRTRKLEVWYDKHMESRQYTPEYAQFQEWSDELLTSKDWKDVRQRIIEKRTGMCAYCKHRRLSKLGKVCDHIIPRVLIYFRYKESKKKMFRRWLDRDNLWLLCNGCHSYKTLRIEPLLTRGKNLRDMDRLLWKEMGLYSRIEEWIKYIRACK